MVKTCLFIAEQFPLLLSLLGQAFQVGVALWFRSRVKRVFIMSWWPELYLISGLIKRLEHHGVLGAIEALPPAVVLGDGESCHGESLLLAEHLHD